MLVINTRPADRADILSKALSAAGYQVIDFALLELTELPLDAKLLGCYLAFEASDPVVVVSPTAAQLGLKHFFNLGGQHQTLKDRKWIAVGQRTANVLIEAGLTVHIPAVENSEGMLSLAIFDDLKRLEQVAFWRGVGGRQFMLDQLKHNKVRILNFELYDRRCPVYSQAEKQAIVTACQGALTCCAVIITSEASWIHWLNLVSDTVFGPQKIHFLVLGERLANLLTAYQLQYQANYSVQVLTSLQSEVVITALQKT